MAIKSLRNKMIAMIALPTLVIYVLILIVRVAREGSMSIKPTQLYVLLIYRQEVLYNARAIVRNTKTGRPQ